MPDASTRMSTSGAPVVQPRILLIDDDPFQLTIQLQVLRGLGFRHVRVAGGAEIALADLRDNPHSVDVIFCDLNMPGMDGIEFLHALNASPFIGHVVLLSGEGTRILHAVQKLLGLARIAILGILEKPAGRAAVKAMLAKWNPTGAAESTAPTRSYSASELAVAAREQQWVLHYQPKVDLKTGSLAGVEALIRWKHPEYGIVMPDHFIGIAEDNDLIDTLTDWVLREAIGQLAIWRDGGLPPVRMAINVSVKNLHAPDFVHHLGSIVRDADVSTSDVTLEVTESRLMSPSPLPLETLVRLRLQRFKLSIDDFGTGHSSLAQLRDVPFTELKVDRGFVKGARTNSIIRPILEGSVGFAKRLGMQSVAEGVETAEDWFLLREIECDFAQGYFIGRPGPAESLQGWLAAWEERREQLVA
jgi:EAL domain-containing protein (putative c-di-GMP-specific phosphodiesterase class I)/CheY-like chemotaxis protein